MIWSRLLCASTDLGTRGNDIFYSCINQGTTVSENYLVTVFWEIMDFLPTFYQSSLKEYRNIVWVTDDKESLLCSKWWWYLCNGNMNICSTRVQTLQILRKRLKSRHKHYPCWPVRFKSLLTLVEKIINILDSIVRSIDLKSNP